MVDEYLPKSDQKLRTLFLDFNSFFASVEQQERPELQHRPIAVLPVDSESTSAIAASREAKKFGVKCGTSVPDARLKCPEIIFVPARPKIYKAYHEALRAVSQNVLPEEKVHSIDEMSFRLLGDEREPRQARAIGQKMKDEIAREIGPFMTCSIGIAPNCFLAKMATELEKPDGLVLLEAPALPGRLLDLKLTDFCGINVRMARRLNASMIFTVKDLYDASRHELTNAFGSIIGERWWFLLRGYEMPTEEHSRKSLSHSHVLAPDLRTDQGCREVLLRLIQKASARLRSENLWTGSMYVAVKGKTKSWWDEFKVPPTQDTLTMNEAFSAAWAKRDFVHPIKVSVNFTDLREGGEVTPSLFTPTVDRAKLSHAVDTVNHKFGKNTIYIAGMQKAKDSADEKIAFNKTWLLSEGKGDNDWKETFRGLLNRDE